MAECRRCHAEILWFRFADTRSAIAVNVTPVVRGNIELRDDGAHRVKPSPVEVRFMPHVATCPDVRKQRAEDKRKSDNERERRHRAQLKLF